MPERFYYLAIDAAVICIPLLASFHPRIRFARHFGAFTVGCFLTLLPFIAWDIAFTEAGVWGFNPRYLTGISLLGLPVEEWLFFICIPFACVFVFHCLGLLSNRLPRNSWYPVLGVVSIGFILVAVIFRDRAYTAMTFALSGLVLGWLSWFQRPDWLPRAILAYLAVIPFFFVSNGLLTGSWIDEQIVWYNNDENMGLRMGTIPFEDTFYGFLLILLNVMIFERFRTTAPGQDPTGVK